MFDLIFNPKGRAKTLFLIYRHFKEKYPNEVEQFYLARVVEAHIIPGGSIPLGKMDITGEKYMREVFGDKATNIDDLIGHIIRVEFPKKYPAGLNLDEIREANRTGRKTKDEELKELIQEVHKKVLG